MKTLEIWHNPRCSKSREAVNIVEEMGIDAKIIKYLDTDITVETMRDILHMLGMPARELMRTTEDIYKELKLKEETDEDALILAMVQNPKLIQRPILIQNSKAIIARPSSRIKEWLA